MRFFVFLSKNKIIYAHNRSNKKENVMSGLARSIDIDQYLNLPILDLSLYNDAKTRSEFLAQLQSYARNIGFFYVTGHGISHQKIKKIKQYTKQFFALDQNIKDNISMLHSPHFRGYSRVGEEYTKNRLDAREQIDIGVEQTAIPLNENTPLWSRLQGPNQWPKEWPEFKVAVQEWQDDLHQVALKLLHVLLQALGLDQHILDAYLTQTPHEMLKLIKYPKQIDYADGQGVGAHKDTNILTLLLQDEVGGLQVLSDQEWIDVPYVQDAFVINIGETLELITNGYLIANTHRVVAPQYQDRYSIAYFISPHIFAGDLPVLPLPKKLQHASRGIQTDPANPLLKNVGENTLKSRLRSHLDVTKRFYPRQYQEILSLRQGDSHE